MCLRDRGSSATPLGANEHAPGSLSVEDRVRIQSELPDSLRNDPQHDPTHPRYDSLSHDSHGNIGTVNPDVPSESGLTNSGRLIDPDVIPEQPVSYTHLDVYKRQVYTLLQPAVTGATNMLSLIHI